MNFNFPPKKGTGIERMLPHASSDAVDLIYQMCAYDPDVRLSAKQGLRHPYFKELRSIAALLWIVWLCVADSASFSVAGEFEVLGGFFFFFFLID